MEKRVVNSYVIHNDNTIIANYIALEWAYFEPFMTNKMNAIF